MGDILFDSVIVVLAYFSGCILCGSYYCLFRTGDDVRIGGDGNASAQSVRRRCGTFAYLLTLVVEFFQGLLTVTVCGLYGNHFSVPLLGLVAVTLGNIAPAQLQFRGGRGFTIALGGLAAFQPTILFCFISTYGVLRAFFPSIVFSRVIALLAIPGVAYLLGNAPQTVGLLAAESIVLLFAERMDVAAEFAKLKRGAAPQ